MKRGGACGWQAAKCPRSVAWKHLRLAVVLTCPDDEGEKNEESRHCRLGRRGWRRSTAVVLAHGLRLVLGALLSAIL